MTSKKQSDDCTWGDYKRDAETMGFEPSIRPEDSSSSGASNQKQPEAKSNLEVTFHPK